LVRGRYLSGEVEFEKNKGGKEAGKKKRGDNVGGGGPSNKEG